MSDAITRELVFSKTNLFLTITGLDILNGAVLSQTEALLEELDELITAAREKNALDFCDGVGDVYFVLYTLSILDPNKYTIFNDIIKIVMSAFMLKPTDTNKDALDKLILKIVDEVCNSNLSKFDNSLAEAVLTQTAYKNLGIESTYRYSTAGECYIPYISYTQRDINGKEYFSGKILKSVNHFVMPNFNDITEELEKLFF